MNGKWQRYWHWHMLFIGALAIFALLVLPGLGHQDALKSVSVALEIIIIASFFANAAIGFLTAKDKKLFFRKNRIEFIIIGIFLLQFVILGIFWQQPKIQHLLEQLGIVSIAEIYIVIAQIFILFELLAQLGQLNTKFASLPLSPHIIFLISYLSVILIGALLLMLPGATKENIHISFLDALFTATSAACVTGLTVVSTASTFTKYGHSVIMVLIQIGGLGLMTFSTFAALILKGELGIKERVLIGDIMNIRIFSKTKSLIASIISMTFIIEIIGAAMLYFAFDRYPEKLLINGQIFFSIFHSVSAFCNAGFCLWDDNLSRFLNNPFGSITIMGLIVLGGLGFIVLGDIWHDLKTPFMRNRLFHPNLTLHTKMVILLSSVLIIAGATLIYMIEFETQLKPLGFWERIIAVLFQSVTPRTAGFNTLNIGSLMPPTLILLIILMFIGASPGSTGGGIKTTTFGTLVFFTLSNLRGEQRMTLFGRTLPARLASQAAMILILALALNCIGLFFLSLFEGNATFLQLLFEQISAFGTVGLSTGITKSLSAEGKIVLMITMFIGRVGLLVFLSAIWARKRPAKMKFPDEEIMIG